MTDFIPMTPGGEVVWKAVGTDRGRAYIPDGSNMSGEIMEALKADVAGLPVIGRETRIDTAVTVYRYGNLAIREVGVDLTEDFGYQGGLHWLRTQLSLEHALRRFCTPEIIGKLKAGKVFPGGIRTPRYLGMISSNKGTHRFVMSDCSKTRKPLRERSASSAFVDGFCRRAVETTYGDDLGIIFDGGPENTLVGPRDAVRLDVFTQKPLITIR